MFENCDVRVPLGKVCSFKSGKTLPKDKEMPSGDFLYAKVGDLNLPGNEMTIRFSRTYVDAATAKKCLVPKGAVVFPKRGGAIGTNKKRVTGEDCCLDLNLMSVIPGGDIRTEYLLACLEQMDLADIANGSTVPQINNKDLDPLIIPLPKMELQYEFANFVTQVDKSRFVYLGSERNEVLSILDMVAYVC
ncbi:restriction endonuclease subunit S [Mobiluncus mulieris]|uniref:restriction endonuclease subunit S n=1 Tax=Mobiluncus mulieris TaxID=2052 RepID=UPI00242FBDC4|nr:restriction endonuclease subunit S [Mobiluncus mulieris]